MRGFASLQGVGFVVVIVVLAIPFSDAAGELVKAQRNCSREGDSCGSAAACNAHLECVCKEGFNLYRDSCEQAVFLPLSDRCPESIKCGGANGTCNAKGQCVCPPDFAQDSRMYCRTNFFQMNGTCGGQRKCSNDKGVCLEQPATGYVGVCACLPSHFVQNGECVSTVLSPALGDCGGGACVCSNGRQDQFENCFCDPAFYAKDDRCVPVDGMEFSDETCETILSVCQNGLCKSKRGDRILHCMCNTGYERDPAPLEGQVAMCVSMAPISHATAGGTSGITFDMMLAFTAFATSGFFCFI